MVAYGADAEEVPDIRGVYAYARTGSLDINYKSEYSSVLKQEKHPFGNNCVRFVKSKRPVPLGMGTLSSKTSHIDSLEPEVGAVAVTPESSFGHLSLVMFVEDDHVIVEEGNYRHGYRTVRRIPQSKVIGYIL
jgi:surface antigen